MSLPARGIERDQGKSQILSKQLECPSWVAVNGERSIGEQRLCNLHLVRLVVAMHSDVLWIRRFIAELLIGDEDKHMRLFIWQNFAVLSVLCSQSREA